MAPLAWRPRRPRQRHVAPLPVVDEELRGAIRIDVGYAKLGEVGAPCRLLARVRVRVRRVRFRFGLGFGFGFGLGIGFGFGFGLSKLRVGLGFGFGFGLCLASPRQFLLGK